MYTLKSIVRRGTPLGAALAIVAAAVFPATSVFADTLNPLTNRSLTLSSSAPGWSNTDGSGNTTYAPPNSGANGQKTGNTFSFDVSSNSSSTPIKTMSFQYCTTSAGDCEAPGNDDEATPVGSDDASHSDLNVVTNNPLEVGDTTNGATGSFTDFVSTSGGNAGSVTTVPNRDGSQGNYVVYYNNGGTWTQSSGWKMSTKNVESGTGTLTGKQNYIILTNTTGLGIPAGTAVKVVFFGTDDNYITNPGSGAFFVKINTYNKEYAETPTAPQVGLTGLEPDTGDNVIDGGVTVANVMNQSIQITTKVLETMQFSVGTVDPNTLSSSDGDATNPSTFEAALGDAADNNAVKHGTCNPIVTGMTPSDPANVLKLGNQNAESSLETEHTYLTHSYWRLSSNSSAGATVYYSGHTLTNTEGDQITPIGVDSKASTPGSEQFGLAIANGTADPYTMDYSQEATYENGADNGKTAVDASTLTDMTVNAGPPVVYNASWHTPQLAPLVPGTNYKDGSGTVNGGSGTKFAFDGNSDTIPVAIATESSSVVDCVTAKMRYMANIAATTPAGIYTTKVNYIAAPQY